MIPFKIIEEVQRQLEEMMGENFNIFSLWRFKTNKFQKKIEKGIVIYKKPNKNPNEREYKQIHLNRRITSLRILTHTKK